MQNEDERDHGDRGQQRTDGVEPVLGLFAGVRDGSQRHDEGHDDERDREDEEPSPARDVDQDGGQVHPQDAPTAGDGGPHADRAERSSSGKVEVMTARVTGMIIARAHAAEQACGEHDLGRRGEARRGAGNSEEDQAGEQHRSAAPAIADRAERQQ